jgi:hypothetical protein
MWIFTSNAFLSVVADQQRPGHLLVRARFKGDIQDVFPAAKVMTTPDRDYRFRTSLPRGEVADRLAGLAHKIDYPNFKNTVRKPRLHEVCSRVWGILFRAQQDAAPRRRRKRALFELPPWEDQYLADHVPEDRLPF